MTDLLAGALAEIRSVIPAEILHDFSDYDGSATILVPNETTVFDLTKRYEGPQIIEFAGDRLETFPTRLDWTARATSTSLRVTDAVTMQNRPDWNMVLVAERRCLVFVGGRWYSDSDFMAMLIKAAGSRDDRSVEQIVTSLKQRGLDFDGSMPMYLQHLGADMDRFTTEIVPLFEAAGGRDNTANIQTTGQKSRTVKSVRLEGAGLRVASMEIGVTDRSRSQNNTGFISFLDGTYTTVRCIIEADRTISRANRVLADEHADEQDKALAQAAKEAAQSYWSSGSQRTRRPFHNWGGTSRVSNVEGLVEYFPTPVPCGRLTLLDVNNNEHTISVWQTATQIAEDRARIAAGAVDAGGPVAVLGMAPNQGAGVVQTNPSASVNRESNASNTGVNPLNDPANPNNPNAVPGASRGVVGPVEAGDEEPF